MKKLFALSVVLLSLVGGSVSAFADEHTVFYPDSFKNGDERPVFYPETFDNAHGINYPELP
jgi:hypothetical protein